MQLKELEAKRLSALEQQVVQLNVERQAQNEANKVARAKAKERHKMESDVSDS